MLQPEWHSPDTSTDRFVYPSMLKPDSLDPLFSLLQEMTLVQREDSAFQPSTRTRRLENAILCGYLAAMALLLSATWGGTHGLQKLAATVSPLYTVMLMFGLA